MLLGQLQVAVLYENSRLGLPVGLLLLCDCDFEA